MKYDYWYDCWWLGILPVGQTFVVTSAPTRAQAEATLRREIDRIKAEAGSR